LRRRLAAVPAVQRKATLKPLNPLLKRNDHLCLPPVLLDKIRNRLTLRLDQSNQLGLREFSQSAGMGGFARHALIDS